jgi:hippurate hydrolase
VVGILKNGEGPTILLRGDMDALPLAEETGLPYASKIQVKRDDGQTVGVMHACGHDIHQTVLVGTAELLAKLKERWRGKVMIVAQPAEEIGMGARAMINDGLFERFDKPDACVALHVSANHPAGVVAYTPGWALANVDSVDITIFGRGGHGSRPHEAIDPIVMAGHVITALQTIVSRRINPNDPAVITVGSIHAGSKHNIIPDTAVLQITVRSYEDRTREILLSGIREVTTNTCRALGAPRDPEIKIREDEFTPSTYNDPALSAAAAEVLKQALGEEKVTQEQPVMGGEDFSEYSRRSKAPGFIFWLGSVSRDRYDASKQPGAPPLPSLHSNKYYPDPKPTIDAGLTALGSLALSLLGPAS